MKGSKKKFGSGRGRSRTEAPTPNYLKKFAAENREKATPAHRYLVGCLKKMGIPYTLYTEHALRAGGQDMILDIYFPLLKFAIEVDGGSHRGQSARDAARDSALADLGIITFRCRNSEVFYDKGDLLNRLELAINQRAAESR